MKPAAAMSAPRIVSCGPIELRLITPRSAGQLFALARDPEASRMLQWEPHRSVEDSLEFIHDARRLWELRTAWLPGIFHTETGALLGTTGVTGIDRANRRAEVGTWLGVQHQGLGYNRPLKAAVATFAFDVLDVDRLEFLVRTDNDRSLRAMRSLPGVREEGTLSQRLRRAGVAYDAVLFALLVDDFDGARWPSVDVRSGAARAPAE